MHSNFVLLSFILKAIPIKPRADSGAFGRSLLNTFASIVPFLNSIPFSLMKVGSSTSVTVESFMTFTDSLPMNFSIDIDELTASSLFLSNLKVCEYKLNEQTKHQMNSVNISLFMSEIFLLG